MSRTVCHYQYVIPSLATIGVLILAFSLSSSIVILREVSVHVQAENINGTTMGKLNLLRGHFTLLPFFHCLPHCALDVGHITA